MGEKHSKSFGELRQMHPLVNLTNPSQMRMAVRNIANVHAAGTPEEHKAGELWYPKVHEAVSKGVKGTHLSHLAGSGLVAAVSPNMDWERNNIGAFKEMHAMKGAQWDAIHQAHASGSKAKPQDVVPELRGTSLGTATTANLSRAGRIYQGEDPDKVLSLRTSPKTHNFAHNIHDPADPNYGTVDYRAHDIVANNMAPTNWTGRSIGSAGGRKASRYELVQHAYRKAGEALGEPPSTVQAKTWVTGKRIETSEPTKSGKPRVKGVARKGQPYIGKGAPGS